MQNYIQIIKRFWYLLIVVISVTTVLSLLLSLFSTPEYKSTVKLLVIQQQADRMDAYTAARSAETVGQTLANVIYTSSFLGEVLKTDFKVQDKFSGDPVERSKQWRHSVDAVVLDDNGTLKVDVYNADRGQAEALAYSVASVLINKSSLYHGGGSQIEVKMIDAPMTPSEIARPSTLSNTAVGLVLGILVSFATILFLEGISGAKTRQFTTGPTRVEEPHFIKFQPPVENIQPQAEIETMPEPKPEIIEETISQPEVFQPVKETPASGNIFSNGILKFKGSLADLQKNLKQREKLYYQEDPSKENKSKQKKDTNYDPYNEDSVNQWVKTGKFIKEGTGV